MGVLVGSLVFSLLLLAVTAFGPPDKLLGSFAAAAHILTALYIYFRHGRSALTPLGVAAIASALLLGVPYFIGLYSSGAFRIGPAENQSSLIAYFAFSVFALIGWRYGPKDFAVVPATVREALAFRVRPLWWTLLCLALLILPSTPIGSLITGLTSATKLAVFCIGLTLVIVLWPRRPWFSILFASLAAGSLAVYYTQDFVGFGRLLLLAFGTAAFLIVSTFYTIRWAKLASVVIVPILVFAAGAIRSDSHEYTVAAALSGDGLTSLVSPFQYLTDIHSRFDQGLVRAGIANWKGGATYLYPALHLIPRVVWPTKPEGLGRQYVAWTHPAIYRAGVHSVSVSYLGEGYINFGNLGFLIAPIVFGGLIALVSRIRNYAFRQKRADGVVAYALVYVLLSAPFVDYVWGDSNTYTHRAIAGMVVLLVLALPLIVTSLGWRWPHLPSRRRRPPPNDVIFSPAASHNRFRKT